MKRVTTVLIIALLAIPASVGVVAQDGDADAEAELIADVLLDEWLDRKTAEADYARGVVTALDLLRQSGTEAEVLIPALTWVFLMETVDTRARTEEAETRRIREAILAGHAEARTREQWDYAWKVIETLAVVPSRVERASVADSGEAGPTLPSPDDTEPGDESTGVATPATEQQLILVEELLSPLDLELLLLGVAETDSLSQEIRERAEYLLRLRRLLGPDASDSSVTLDVSEAVTGETSTEETVSDGDVEREQAAELPATATDPQSGAEFQPFACNADPLPQELDPTVTHGRWNGLWNYSRTPEGPLSLYQQGAYVCGDFDNGNGWVKLAVVGDHNLSGYWYAVESPTHACDEPRDGTYKWGRLDLPFDEEFTTFSGYDGACHEPMGPGAYGHRPD